MLAKLTCKFVRKYCGISFRFMFVQSYATILNTRSIEHDFGITISSRAGIRDVVAIVIPMKIVAKYVRITRMSILKKGSKTNEKYQKIVVLVLTVILHIAQNAKQILLAKIRKMTFNFHKKIKYINHILNVFFMPVTQAHKF